MWLVKRSDEKWFGVQVSLRRCDEKYFSHDMVKEKR
jgi:hypothetical protein